MDPNQDLRLLSLPFCAALLQQTRDLDSVFHCVSSTDDQLDMDLVVPKRELEKFVFAWY